MVVSTCECGGERGVAHWSRRKLFFGSSLFHVGGKCLHSGLKALKKVHYERD